MRTLHLCCGRGGSLWTGAILGWQSVASVDHDAWRIECLRREAAAGWWPGLNAICADIGADWHARVDGRVDILAAGFSCRDISSAGAGAGLDGPSTGPTYRGVLGAVDYFRPPWVFLENSPAIRTRGRARVTADFVARGYGWRDGVIAAADVGAPHGRARWFMLAADLDHLRQLQLGRGEREGRGWPRDGAAPSPADPVGLGRQERPPGGAGALLGSEGDDEPGRSAARAADALRDGLEVAVQRGGVSRSAATTIEAAARYCGAHAWNPLNAALLRVVDGMADRGKRNASLGDAWVPLQAAVAYTILGGPVSA